MGLNSYGTNSNFLDKRGYDSGANMLDAEIAGKAQPQEGIATPPAAYVPQQSGHTPATGIDALDEALSPKFS